MSDQPAPDYAPMTEELALLSHDIRSTLADILAGLTGITENALPPEDQQQLARTRAASEGLRRLLENGLNTLLTGAPVAIQQDIIETTDFLAALARRWSHTNKGQLTVQITSSNLPDRFRCDAIALERILANLLNNAIAHSNTHPVTLDLQHPDPETLRIVIQDHGPGFPGRLTNAGAHHKAFSAWHSVDGHGLGLRIAHCLANRMQAAISLQNPAEGGGLAILSLPIQTVPNTHCPPDSSPENPETLLHNQNVLIAEDSPAQLLFLGQILMNMGAKVTMLADGETVLEVAKTKPYDLVLIDHEMPGRSGLELCAALNSLSPRPKLVLLTAHNGAEFRSNALAAGADQVIEKPITSANHLRAALTKTASGPSQPAAFLHLLDIAGPDMAAELIARFQADLANVQTSLQKALHPQNTPDWPPLCTASHVLIALAGTAGAPGLEATARKFNDAATRQDHATLNHYRASLLTGLAALITFVDKTAQQRSALI